MALSEPKQKQITRTNEKCMKRKQNCVGNEDSDDSRLHCRSLSRRMQSYKELRRNVVLRMCFRMSFCLSLNVGCLFCLCRFRSCQHPASSLCSWQLLSDFSPKASIFIDSRSETRHLASCQRTNRCPSNFQPCINPVSLLVGYSTEVQVWCVHFDLMWGFICLLLPSPFFKGPLHLHFLILLVVRSCLHGLSQRFKIRIFVQKFVDPLALVKCPVERIDIYRRGKCNLFNPKCKEMLNTVYCRGLQPSR